MIPAIRSISLRFGRNDRMNNCTLGELLECSKVIAANIDLIVECPEMYFRKKCWHRLFHEASHHRKRHGKKSFLSILQNGIWKLCTVRIIFIKKTSTSILDRQTWALSVRVSLDVVAGGFTRHSASSTRGSRALAAGGTSGGTSDL